MAPSIRETKGFESQTSVSYPPPPLAKRASIILNQSSQSIHQPSSTLVAKAWKDESRTTCADYDAGCESTEDLASCMRDCRCGIVYLSRGSDPWAGW